MVMKNAFVKDSLRQVRVTINRFIAILAVTALGVAFFAGLKATAPDMRDTAEAYFKSLSFMDVSLLSTAGFTQADLDAVRAVTGVAHAEPGYTADAAVALPRSSLTVKLLSLNTADLSGAINRPKLTQGRLPAGEGEILADPRFLMLSGHRLGDTVTVGSGSGGDLSSTLSRDTFTIVGVAEDPLYISYERGSSTVGSGKVDAYLILPEAVFTLPAYTEIDLTVKNPAGLSRFAKGYDDLVKPVAKALEALSPAREQARYDELRAQGQQQLDDAKAQLSQGRQALADAQKQLDDAQKQLDDGRQALAAGQKQLDDETAAAQRQLDDAQAQLDAGTAAYQQNLAAYTAGKAQYDAGAAQLAAAEQQAGTAGKTDADVQSMIDGLKVAQALYPQFSQPYQTYAAQIAGLQGILQGRAQAAQLDAAKARLDAAQAQLAQSAAQLDQGRRQLAQQKADGQKTLDEKRAQLDAAAQTLAQGRADYERQAADAQPKLADAAARISDGEQQLAQLKKPVWYVLDHNTNAGFVGFKQDADRVEAIANVFPLIFFIVAALVSLTTMTRMVEDDRSYIGTMKALGYGRAAVAARYLLYALSASLIGSALGLVIGYNLFPRVVFDAYGILYTLPGVTIRFNIPYAVLSTAAAVLCAALPALGVCLSSLHSSPAALMRPKVPQGGRRIALERVTPLWKRMNFSQKVTARNLFRYKKRLIMTLVGVAGCTGLVFTGFGLRDSISTIVGKQYAQIRTYDMEIDLRENPPAADTQALSAYLSGKIRASIPVSQQSVDVLKGDRVKSAYLVVPETPESIIGYINLRRRADGRALGLSNDRVIVTEKLASLYGLRVGGSLTLRSSSGAQVSVTVGGICENYLFHDIFMSPALYEKVFGEKPVFNQLLCKLPDTSLSAETALSGGLMQQKAVGSVSFTTRLRENFQKMIEALRYVVLVLILSAAALALVVLFSLTSINIDERRRELATIKVLGFYNGELAGYIYRENMVLTVLGSLLGLILGIFMQRFVIVTTEVDLVMFSRDILFQTYLWSAGLTVVFAGIVNACMYPRFPKIDMVSSLKSVE